MAELKELKVANLFLYYPFHRCGVCGREQNPVVTVEDGEGHDLVSLCRDCTEAILTLHTEHNQDN